MRIAFIWACLFVRLAFYASMLPLWEGVDEWAHFAVVQSVALRGDLLPSRNRPIPRNIEDSLRLVPLPWELRHFSAPSVTHDVYWQLPEQERRARIAALRAIPPAEVFQDGSGAFSNYEAQQPPLYYWIVAPLVWLMRERTLPAQVLAVRLLSALIASLVSPLVYRIGRNLFPDERMALGCAAIIAVMPGFANAVAHVSNDALAAPLYATVIWFGLKSLRGASLLPLGIALGLGLLTKAYFLTAIPPVLWLILRLRAGALTQSRDRKGAVAVCAPPILLAGWWYVRAFFTSGSLLTSGAMAGVQLSPIAVLRSLPSVPWLRALDATLFSHIYSGGWSWLTVRSWMYHVFYLVLAFATIGLYRWLRKPCIQWLLAIYLFFWVGELWHAALMFIARGVPASMGYYLYAVVAAEVPLAVAGLSTWLRRWAAPLGALMFAALDLAAMHLLALPYYTGAIRHLPDGTLHFAQWSRITFPATPLWICYVLATVAAVVSCCQNVARGSAAETLPP